MDLGSDQRGPPGWGKGRMICCLSARLEPTPMPTLHSKARAASSQLWNQFPGAPRNLAPVGQGAHQRRLRPMRPHCPQAGRKAHTVSLTQDGSLSRPATASSVGRLTKTPDHPETWKCVADSPRALGFRRRETVARGWQL